MGSVTDFINARKKKDPTLRIGSLKEITKSQKRPPMSTGNIVADYVTSIGGIPRGAVTEIRGFNSSGKTTLSAMIAANHQKLVKAGYATGAILYIDFEFAVDEDYFAALGLDINDEETFVFYQPDTLEEGFNMFLDMTKAGLLALGIVDSVAGASAGAEYDAAIGKASIGLKARALNQSLRMTVGPMKVHGTGLILINHIQSKIPVTFGEKQSAMRGIIETISPGGRAMEFYPSLRLELSKPYQNKSEVHDELTNEKSKQITSTEVVITAFKNKVGVPHRTARMRVAFGKGFSQNFSAFHILVDHGIIKKKTGGHFTFPDELLPPTGIKQPVGEDNIVAGLDASSEWADKLVSAASKLVLNQQVDQADVDILVVDGEVIDPETGEVVTDV